MNENQYFFERAKITEQGENPILAISRDVHSMKPFNK